MVEDHPVSELRLECRIGFLVDRAQVETGGRVIVALRMYFKEALVKVEIATASGKKQFDKREDLKKREQNLEARRAIQSRQ